MIRSIYCVLPISVYLGSSTIPQHTDPITGSTISARDIYPGKTFKEVHPDARTSLDGTKVIIKDPDWTDEDMFGVNILIAASGNSRRNVDGTFKYGILQWKAAIELMRSDEWVTNEAE